MMTMKTFTTDCEKLPTLNSPSCVEEFKAFRGNATIFRGAISNPLSLKLNFETAKAIMPNTEINLSYSLDNDDLQLPCKLHKYIDYCLGKRSLPSGRAMFESGKTTIGLPSEFTAEDKLYCFTFNPKNDDLLARLISCPDFMGDLFDKILPSYKNTVVEGVRHMWFFIGPQGTISEMHSDHNYIHTTIQQLDGKKRFVLISPSDMLKVNELFGDYTKQLRFFIKEDKECFIELIDGDLDLSVFEAVKIYWADLEKHDTVYLPAGWGHYAESLSPSFSISRDFIDETNIDSYFLSMLLESHYNFSDEQFNKGLNLLKQHELQL